MCAALARSFKKGDPLEAVVAASTILWAEDNVGDQVLIRAAVEGFQDADSIEFVPDGVALMEALQKAQPTLVVLDLEMPRMGGIETLRAIRADEKLRNQRVVVFTTSNLPSDVDTCRQLGAEYVLQKPVDFSVFRTLVQGILSRLRSPPGLAATAAKGRKRAPRTE